MRSIVLLGTLTLALLFVPAVASADGDKQPEPTPAPAPAPAPRLLGAPVKNEAVAIEGRDCDSNALGQVVCKKSPPVERTSH